jgi:hypothetical protein
MSELNIDRIRLEDGEDCDCDACGVPLFPGEACCRDAAKAKMKSVGFELQREPAARYVPIAFTNNTNADGSPRRQKVLFAGLDCLPGQADLFDAA